MAFDTLKGGWSWFVDGLAEALLWGQDRWTRRPTSRIEIVDGIGKIVASDGSSIGQIVDRETTARLEPPDIAQRLTGAAIDIHVPPTWLFRRDLDPVATQSAPYLDAFVRHQIDRVTPWRVADVHYRTMQAPVPGDPTRLSVEIGVVPKRLVQSIVDGLLPLSPRHIRLIAQHPSCATEFAIPVSDRSSERTGQLRPWIAAGVAAIGLGLVAAIGGAWWESGIVRAEIADQNQVIEQRNQVLAAAIRRDQAGAAAEGALRALRASRPKVFDLIDALSAALPDSAYLTDLTMQKDQIQITGVTRNLPQLVPALESSHRFKDAAFVAATTKLEGRDGDRFHIEMRAYVSGEGAPPT